MDQEVHVESCLKVSSYQMCTCPPGSPINASDLHSVVAVVRTGDRLIFLIPELAGQTLRELDIARQILQRQHPGIIVNVVPAVGVVHIPAPDIRVDHSPTEADRLRAASITDSR